VVCSFLLLLDPEVVCWSQSGFVSDHEGVHRLELDFRSTPEAVSLIFF
jgi:hypothetical protein